MSQALAAAPYLNHSYPVQKSARAQMQKRFYGAHFNIIH